MMAKWERLRRVAAPALALGVMWLSGCTTYVTTRVTAFSQWSGSDATRTYAFARTPAQQNSLEEATYEQLVASELEKYSFKQAPGGQAHYLVSLMYATQAGTATVTQPVYYTSPWPGPFWRPIDPWWGPFGPYPSGYVSQTYPIYTHALGIRITERASGQEVYNVTAQNTDEDLSLVRAMPYLVRSALADFPLGNGVVRTVRIPLDKRGQGVSDEAAVTPAVRAGAGTTSGAQAPSAQ
jgi:hypothetical protein